MALVLQVVSIIIIIIIISSSSSSNSSSTQHLAEFAVCHLPAVTNNYYCLLNIL